MKNRALIPLAIGLVVGLIAIKYSVDVVKRASAASKNEDMIKVVVAQQTIPMGVEIKSGMLSVAKASRALSPQGSVSDPVKLVGRVVRTQIPKGVPVIEEMLAAPGTPAGMSSLVPSGYRAVAVRVDEYTSVGGFLKPGCRVDVAAVMNVRTPGAGSQTISRVILQDVTVGAVGQSLTGEDDTKAASVSRSVTLLVKPEEVPVLNLAATQGQIRLALRHYEDNASQAANIATQDQLIGRKKTDEKETFLSRLAQLLQRPQQDSADKGEHKAKVQPKPVPVTGPYTMTVISGNATKNVSFENENSTRRVDGKGRGSFAGATAMAPVEPGHIPGLPDGQASGDRSSAGPSDTPDADASARSGRTPLPSRGE